MILLLLIAAAVLSIEVAYESSLALSVKKSLRLDVTPLTVEAMSKVGFYNSLLGNPLKYILFPIVLVFLILATIYKKLVLLLACPYCLGFWLGSLSTYFYLGNPLMESIIYGLLVIPLVHIVEKIYDY